MSSIKLGCFACALAILLTVLVPTLKSVLNAVETEPPKGKRKRLALHDTGNSRRFQFISKQDVEVAQQPYVPPNTKMSRQWALKFFVECKQVRQLTGEDCCPEDLLERVDPTDLVKWLSLFAVEAKQAKGACYTPVTNSQLLGGLLRFMRSMNKSAPNFMDKKDTRFSPLHNVLDHHYHKLCTMNIRI